MYAVVSFYGHRNACAMYNMYVNILFIAKMLVHNAVVYGYVYIYKPSCS